MFTSLNPGTFATAPVPEFPNFVFIALGVVGLAIIIVGLKTRRLPVYILGFLLTFGPLVSYGIWHSVQSEAAGTEHAAEYADTVRSWLDAEYDIAVSPADAAKLAYGEELALVIGGEPTAIGLIDGAGETIAVKVVGGSILIPTE